MEKYGDAINIAVFWERLTASAVLSHASIT